MTSPEYALTDIHHVQIAMPPEEEDAGMRFYGELLGLERIPKSDALAPRGGLWFRLGDREVHLVVEEDVQFEGFGRFHVRDPFGNRLELIEPL